MAKRPAKKATKPAPEQKTLAFWDLGSREMTIAFWIAILVIIVGIFRCKLLPLVDYPQHIAVAETLRRTIFGHAPEATLYETNVLSYNSAFHLIVAFFGSIMPIERAGQIGVALYVVLFAFGGLALLRAAGRPLERAFLFLPVVFGYHMTWGFVNFGIALAVQFFVLARVLAKVKDGSDRWTRRDAITLALISTLGAWGHLMATVAIYMLVLVVLTVDFQTRKDRIQERLLRSLRLGAPLLVAPVYCAFVFWRQSRAHVQNWGYSYADGYDNLPLAKVRTFLDVATNFRADHFDARVLGAALVILAVSAILRDTSEDAHPSLRWMLFISVIAYLICPHVLWATTHVGGRLSVLVVISAVLYAPCAMPKLEPIFRIAFVPIGFGAAGGVHGVLAQAGTELADLDALIDDAPEGRSITALINDPQATGCAQSCLLHSASFYVARKGGEAAFSFTRAMSLPVHYRPSTRPPEPPLNFEWNPYTYDAEAEYARHFDVVLLKTVNDDQTDPRPWLFGTAAQEVDILAHHGKWWMLDTKKLTVTSSTPLP